MVKLRGMNGKPLIERTIGLRASRRTLLLAGAGVGVAGAVGFLAQRPSTSTQLGGIDGRNIVALEDGFYLVDGWVLTADDLDDDGALRTDASGPR